MFFLLTIFLAIKAIENKSSFDGVKGLTYYDNSKIITNAEEKIIEDLD